MTLITWRLLRENVCVVKRVLLFEVFGKLQRAGLEHIVYALEQIFKTDLDSADIDIMVNDP